MPGGSGVRSAGVAAIEQIISTNKFPTVVGGTSVAIWEEGGGYIFRYRACDQIVAQAAIDYACRDLGYKNVGILYNNDDYGNGAKKVMEEYVAASYPDVKIGAAEGHNTGDKDMTAGLLACKNAGCDVIIGWTHAPECAVMTRQYRELGLDSIFFLGGPGWGMPGFHALIEDDIVNGLSTITDFAADNAEPQTQDFLKAYKEKYGKDADSFAAYYYDGVSIVLEALKLAKTMDREGLMAAFPEVAFDGISGKIYLDSEHNMDFVHRVCTAVIKAENGVKTLTDVKFVTFYE